MQRLDTGNLSHACLRQAYSEPVAYQLDDMTQATVNESAHFVAKIVDAEETVYGINTGFGKLASCAISRSDLTVLQHNIVVSHAAGMGKPLPHDIVRLALLIKINSLAQGYSGIQLKTLDYLLGFLNADMMPQIPESGSVGASGDLAPLAHLACVMLGIGTVSHQQIVLSAEAALAQMGRSPISLHPKEGLALINGTQISNALALAALYRTERLLKAAIWVGSLSIDAASASHRPLDPRIHAIRRQTGQMAIAGHMRALLAGSEIKDSHADCPKVQDPYSLRCQPQVLGAVLDTLQHVGRILLAEANAVTDNPLLFVEDGETLSGGNFHAEPVALVADMLAIGISEIGAIAERRVALLMDHHFSGLSPFLTPNPGLNSGLMVSQYTAASLASENKILAHPASVDSIPTCANQEDHVSMATHGARRLHQMIDNTERIVAIELFAAAQAVYLRDPVKTSPRLASVLADLHEIVPPLTADRFLAQDLATLHDFIREDFTDLPDLLD